MDSSFCFPRAPIPSGTFFDSDLESTFTQTHSASASDADDSDSDSVNTVIQVQASRIPIPSTPTSPVSFRTRSISTCSASTYNSTLDGSMLSSEPDEMSESGVSIRTVTRRPSRIPVLVSHPKPRLPSALRDPARTTLTRPSLRRGIAFQGLSPTSPTFPSSSHTYHNLHPNSSEEHLTPPHPTTNLTVPHPRRPSRAHTHPTLNLNPKPLSTTPSEEIYTSFPPLSKASTFNSRYSQPTKCTMTETCLVETAKPLRSSFLSRLPLSPIFWLRRMFSYSSAPNIEIEAAGDRKVEQGSQVHRRPSTKQRDYLRSARRSREDLMATLHQLLILEGDLERRRNRLEAKVARLRRVYGEDGELAEILMDLRSVREKSVEGWGCLSEICNRLESWEKKVEGRV